MSRSSAFRYRAARKDGTIELGTVEAASEGAVNALLIDRGLFPVDVQAGETARDFRQSISPDDLALGLRMLSSFLEAGLPLARALAALRDVVPPSWEPLLEHIMDEVRQGSALAPALQSSPVRVAPIVIGVIQAGEAGSGLASAVKRSAELIESAVATRRAITAALAYPIILAVAGSASLALLVGVVLPKFAAILADLGQALPPTTRLVLGISEGLRLLFVPLLALAGVLLLVWRGWVSTEKGRAQWHTLLLHLPLIGPIRASNATSRIAASLSALLDAGVPLVAALGHVGRAGADAAMAARILVARESISHGSRVSSALENEGALTTTALKLIRAGEETGQLSSLLAHAGRIEGDRAQQRIRGLVRLLEPLLIVGFGLVVAVVAAALLQAVYSVRPTS